MTRSGDAGDGAAARGLPPEPRRPGARGAAAGAVLARRALHERRPRGRRRGRGGRALRCARGGMTLDLAGPGNAHDPAADRGGRGRAGAAGQRHRGCRWPTGWRGRAPSLADQVRDDLVAMFAAYDEDGLVGDPTVLPRLLGRPLDDLGDPWPARWLRAERSSGGGRRGERLTARRARRRLAGVGAPAWCRRPNREPTRPEVDVARTPLASHSRSGATATPRASLSPLARLVAVGAVGCRRLRRGPPRRSLGGLRRLGLPLAARRRPRCRRVRAPADPPADALGKPLDHRRIAHAILAPGLVRGGPGEGTPRDGRQHLLRAVLGHLLHPDRPVVERRREAPALAARPGHAPPRRLGLPRLPPPRAHGAVRADRRQREPGVLAGRASSSSP